MTLDQYNESVKAILADQQAITTLTATLAMAGAANVSNPRFIELMGRQMELFQRIAKLNTDMLLGIVKSSGLGST